MTGSSFRRRQHHGQTDVPEVGEERRLGPYAHGFEILRVKVYGNAGIVMQRGTSAGTWQGQAFSNYEIVSTVFIYDGRWLAVQTMIAPAKQPSEIAAR